MRQLYEAYRNDEKVAPLVRQLPWLTISSFWASIPTTQPAGIRGEIQLVERAFGIGPSIPLRPCSNCKPHLKPSSPNRISLETLPLNQIFATEPQDASYTGRTLLWDKYSETLFRAVSALSVSFPWTRLAAAWPVPLIEQFSEKVLPAWHVGLGMKVGEQYISCIWGEFTTAISWLHVAS
jgi:hypothetical protein